MTKDIKDIIIWGIGKQAERFVDYLAEVGINVKHYVDLHNAGNMFRGKLVLSPNKFKHDFFPKDRLIPIVITSQSEAAEDRFAHTVDYIVNDLGLLNAKLLHPAFLIDHVALKYSGRAVTIGFPRTGNWLLKFIIMKLLEKTTEVKGEKEVFFEGLASNHYHTLVDTLNGSFALCKPKVMNIFSIKRDVLSCFAYKYREFMHFSDIKTKAFLTHKFFHSHDHPVNIAPFRQMGYNVFVPVRNPMDVIISFAFKFVHTVISMEPERDLNKTESPFREIYGDVRLANLDWFEDMAARTKAYYEEFINLQNEDMHVVRYEDIITNPIAIIQEIAIRLGVEASEDEIRSIWNEYGFKPLMPGEKTHMFKPGAGKWKKYFTKHHVDILKSLDYPALLREYGYNEELSEGLFNANIPTATYTDDYDLYLALHDYIYYVLFGVPVTYQHFDVTCTKRVELDFQFVTKGQTFYDAMLFMLNNPYCRKIISSLDY
ncbi:MAG: sulfotransferase domain-containing protein [Candidatus Magnetoovum sp. WYHC-5]|nr:sulfotransferase domain-containing protein [Candidatus Magnetoovum sp. WYHC-5]